MLPYHTPSAKLNCSLAGYPKKGHGLLREGSDMKFVFIAKHRSVWPVAWLCDAMGVSRSGFQCLAEPMAQRQIPE